MKDLHSQLARLMAAYPDRSQAEADDPLVVVKLFLLNSGVTWWLTEYDAETRIAFCYVTGMAYDEWGSVSIDEIAALRWMGIPSVERDEHFEPTRFSVLKANGFRA